MPDNYLYYGNNLDILRHRIAPASVDLVYLDPPFNSNADYNVIFREQSGEKSAAQIKAFTDTWHWIKEDGDQSTERAYEDILTNAPDNVAKMLESMVRFIGRNDVTAYLVMMTQRLVELHRALKPTGSLYLHCDPTASHYLKIVLDTIFGPQHYRTEIVWKRSSAHSDTKQGRAIHGHIHDTILFYTKSDEWTWNPQFTPYSQEYIDEFYRYSEPGTGRRYRLGDLTAAKPGGDTDYEWKGVRPYKGRYWAYSRTNMEKFEADGRLVYTKSGMPNYKRYLDEMPGVSLQDIWTDIRPISGLAAERMGYPTQKPLALLERMIAASSNPGDVVLDPFCGCGTAICAAEKLGRHWIGIDVTHLAVSLMKSRLKDMFGLDANKDYKVWGEPTDVAGARNLALDDRYQFQYWAVSLVEATAQDQERQQKKGADKGIDGIIPFIDGYNRRREVVVVQVKSGHVTSSHIRDLKGVLDREKAAMGLYICLESPTKDMLEEANNAGFYSSERWTSRHGDHRFPRIQIRTVEELLAGRDFDLPPRPVQFKQAARVQAQVATGPDLWSVSAATGIDADINTEDDDLVEMDEEAE